MLLEGFHVGAFLATLLAFGFDALFGMRIFVVLLEALLRGEYAGADLAQMLLAAGLQQSVVETGADLAVSFPDVTRKILDGRNFQQTFGTGFVDFLVLLQLGGCWEGVSATGLGEVEETE